MKNIRTFIDNSQYINNVCFYTNLISKTNNSKADIIYVLPHHDIKRNEFSGVLEFNNNDKLMNDIVTKESSVYQDDYDKSSQINNHVNDIIQDNNLIKFHKQRGDLIEIMKNFQESSDMFIIGKGGENNNKIGKNIENILDNTNIPIFLSNNSQAIQNFDNVMIAYGNKKLDNKKILEFIVNNSFLNNTTFHLVHIGKVDNDNIYSLQETLSQNRIKAKIIILDKESEVELNINRYIIENNIQLVFIGRYSHNKISRIFYGSNTNHIIEHTDVPVICF